MTIFNCFLCRSMTTVLALACAVLVSVDAVWAGDAEKAHGGEQEELDVAAIRALTAASFVVAKTGGIRMILIKPGTFTMGSPPSEVGRGDDETQHKVTISRPFYMAEAETTHAQYLPIMWPRFRPILVGRHGSGGLYRARTRTIARDQAGRSAEARRRQ